MQQVGLQTEQTELIAPPSAPDADAKGAPSPNRQIRRFAMTTVAEHVWRPSWHSLTTAGGEGTKFMGGAAGAGTLGTACVRACVRACVCVRVHARAPE